MRARFVFEHAANIKDKYYANPYVLLKLYDAVKKNIPMEEVTEIVEPAAGDGAIIPYIEELAEEYDIPTKYYDLDPDIPEIEQMNFYKTSLQYLPGRLVMTGPPYSGRNWLLFAKKAAEIGDWVAFISPHSFLDYKNPIPDLELIYQENLGLQDFSGSKVFGGKDHKVKTAILLYKKIDPQTDEVEDAIEEDFSFRQFKRGQDPKGYDYFVSRQGSNAGEVSDDPDAFFSSIGVKVNNEDMRTDLEEFLDGLKTKYDHLFTKYSPTTKKTINLPRLKSFIRKDLYSFMNEAIDFQRGQDPKESMGLGLLARNPVIIHKNYQSRKPGYYVLDKNGEWLLYQEDDDDQIVKYLENLLGEWDLDNADEWREYNIINVLPDGGEDTYVY